MESNLKKRIVVVGGGISGLAAAYYLQKDVRQRGLNAEICLIEAEERLGGKIITDALDNFVIEGGPDCFLRSKPWAYQLAEELGITAEVIGTNDLRRKTFVLDQKKLKPLPEGVMLIIPTKIRPFLFSPLFTLPGKLRMGMDLFLPRRKGDEDESIGEFVTRRLGREALVKLAEPLLSGIHVSDPDKQSLLATFPRFRNLEKKHRSLILGMMAAKRHPVPAQPANGQPSSMFLSFKQGMGYFVEQLEKHLSGVQVYKNKRVLSITQKNEHYRLSFAGGESLEADGIILAVPAYAAGEILNGLDPELNHQLHKIPYVSTATVSAAYPRADFPQNMDGFGFLVPRTEKRKITACTWSSNKFNFRAHDDQLLIRCFLGGPGREEQVDWDDQTIKNVVKEELKDLLGITAAPLLVKIYRWKNANPQYEVGHLELVRAVQAFVQQKYPRITLTGSAFDGVGVPDCIRQGKESAQLISGRIFEGG